MDKSYVYDIRFKSIDYNKVYRALHQIRPLDYPTGLPVHAPYDGNYECSRWITLTEEESLRLILSADITLAKVAIDATC